MDAITFDAVVRDGKIALVDESFYRTRSASAAKRWGDGRCLKVRIEPEEDAYTYAQIKHYWGYVVTPFADYTGYHKHEVHKMLKAECMPDGKTERRADEGLLDGGGTHGADVVP